MAQGPREFPLVSLGGSSILAAHRGLSGTLACDHREEGREEGPSTSPGGLEPELASAAQFRV